MEILDLTITALSHDGRGIARRNGKAVFVTGALPGEMIRARISADHARFDEAQLLQVHTPAPGRIVPACPHFGICGGCSLQHLDIDLQRIHKEQVLKDALERIGRITPAAWLPLITSSPWGYRCRTRLGVDRTRAGEIRLGYRGKASHHLMDLTDCPVLHPALLALLPKLRAQVLSIVRSVTEVDLAQGDEGCGLRLHLATTPRRRDFSVLEDFARDEGLRVWLCGPGAHSLRPMEPAPLIYRLPKSSVEFHYTPADFTQINLSLNRSLVTTVLELLVPVPGERVLDLYCGLGNFTLPLARIGAEVVGIEGDADLVRRARSNAHHNALSRARFQCADLSKDGLPLADGFEKVLLDPPRAGAEVVIHHLAKLRVQRIVYVSCHPGTLARDAAYLVREGGYCLKTAGLVDMFPHTAHGECVALFTRDSPASSYTF
ncbi:23S rRNA (uracil(1939)-C(5))-methyltransferase RlmD [Gammaproteobacteria bacterium]